jgi:hypothetical protein
MMTTGVLAVNLKYLMVFALPVNTMAMNPTRRGSKISLGFGAVSAVQTIDADGNSDRKLYSARIGYLEPNLFTPMFLSKKSALKIPLKGRVKYQKFVLF